MGYLTCLTCPTSRDLVSLSRRLLLCRVVGCRDELTGIQTDKMRWIDPDGDGDGWWPLKGDTLVIKLSFMLQLKRYGLCCCGVKLSIANNIYGRKGRGGVGAEIL